MQVVEFGGPGLTEGEGDERVYVACGGMGVKISFLSLCNGRERGKEKRRTKGGKVMAFS